MGTQEENHDRNVREIAREELKIREEQRNNGQTGQFRLVPKAQLEQEKQDLITKVAAMTSVVAIPFGSGNEDQKEIEEKLAVFVANSIYWSTQIIQKSISETSKQLQIQDPLGNLERARGSERPAPIKGTTADIIWKLEKHIGD